MKLKFLLKLDNFNTITINKVISVFLILFFLITYVQSTDQIINEELDNSGSDDYYFDCDQQFSCLENQKGQKMSVTFHFNDPVLVTIYQQVKWIGDQKDVKVIYLNNSLVKDGEFEVILKYTGPIQIYVDRFENGSILGSISGKINGYPPVFQNFLLTVLGLLFGFSFVKFCIRYAFFTETQKVTNKLIKSKYNHSFRSSLNIIQTRLSKSLMLIGFFYPIFLILSVDSIQSIYPDDFLRLFNLNNRPKQNRTDQIALFLILITRLTLPFMIILGIGAPLLLARQTYDEQKFNNLHEKTYPLFQIKSLLSMNIGIFIYLFIIPLFYFSVIVYMSYIYETVNIQLKTIILAIIYSAIICFTFSSILIAFYQIFSSFWIRIPIPVYFTLSIIGVLNQYNRHFSLFTYIYSEANIKSLALFAVFCSLISIFAFIIQIYSNQIKNKMYDGFWFIKTRVQLYVQP